jgi:hypothetical protein
MIVCDTIETSSTLVFHPLNKNIKVISKMDKLTEIIYHKKEEIPETFLIYNDIKNDAKYYAVEFYNNGEYVKIIPIYKFVDYIKDLHKNINIENTVTTKYDFGNDIKLNMKKCKDIYNLTHTNINELKNDEMYELKTLIGYYKILDKSGIFILSIKEVDDVYITTF